MPAGYALGRIKVSNRFLRLLSLPNPIIKFSLLTQINPIDPVDPIDVSI